MEHNVSTLLYKSNIYPVRNNFREDRKFLSQVHDPFSLEIMKKKNMFLTAIQQREFDYASLHCAYAFKDDYPWGTIALPEKEPAVVCKCTNTGCIHFRDCRPDFDIAELEVYEENESVQPEIFSFEHRKDDAVQIIPGNAEATVEKLFTDDKVAASIEDSLENQTTEEVQVDGNDPFVVISGAKPSLPDTEKAPIVDFTSFVDTTQEEIIESEPTDRIIINAGPGTGKTWTLIEKIIYMVSEKDVDASNILVLCFSRAAVEVIKNRLSAAASEGRIDYSWRNIDIRTFDSFATYMLAWVQQELPELLPAGFNLEANNYEQRIQQAIKILEQKKDILGDYEQIIVDEVQDLVGNRAKMVITLLSGLPESCGFTLLGDSCQALYDYLADDDPGVMTSEQFYDELFECFPCANYYSLIENHRQGDELGSVMLPYRNAILGGDASTRSEKAAEILAEIPFADIRLQHFSRNTAGQYARQGTLGILTRTNGQALQISAWLRNENVPHSLQRGMGMLGLGDWISKVFYSYKNETVDESAFIAQHILTYPNETIDRAKERWYALVNSQISVSPKQRYEVRDLLFGLIRNSREPEIYRSENEKAYAITVSNIHRAKGREFDSVILIDDVIKAMTEQDNDDILEHKVCYVALTRPKKKIEFVNLPTQYIYIAKNASRRCSKASRRPGRKPYISHFEVGSNDMDVETFAESPERQSYIRNNLQPGMRLKLKKCPQGTRPYVTYSVVIEDQEKTVLGYTGRKFAEELDSSMRRIFKITSSIKYDIFPHAFCDVYVGSITSHISSGTIPEGARVFGDVSLWTGFTITGFAAVDRDTY